MNSTFIITANCHKVTVDRDGVQVFSAATSLEGFDTAVYMAYQYVSDCVCGSSLPGFSRRDCD